LRWTARGVRHNSAERRLAVHRSAPAFLIQANPGRSVRGQINALANQVNYATINLKLWPSRWIAGTSPVWDDLREWLAGADEREYDAASGWVGGCTYR
jgi:hypothetical protein